MRRGKRREGEKRRNGIRRKEGEKGKEERTMGKRGEKEERERVCAWVADDGLKLRRT